MNHNINYIEPNELNVGRFFTIHQNNTPISIINDYYVIRDIHKAFSPIGLIADLNTDFYTQAHLPPTNIFIRVVFNYASNTWNVLYKQPIGFIRNLDQYNLIHYNGPHNIYHATNSHFGRNPLATQFRPITNNQTNLECPICMDPMTIDEEISSFPSCGHRFHKRCINTALLRDRRCPICRAISPTPSLQGGKHKTKKHKNNKNKTKRRRRR